jgi:hypothetical protein
MAQFWRGFGEGFREARLSERASAAALVLGGAIGLAVMVLG